VLRIAVDAMGGDHAPDEIVKGAAAASLTLADTELILVGDTQRVGRVLAEVRHDAERVRVHHAGEIVGMHEKPAEALAAKPDSSILVATRLVARGEADALVSAGNTGAGVLACSRTFRLIPGIRRAALASVYPTAMRRGEKDDPFSLILDIGATLDVSAEDLVAFALMGSAYASRISRNPRPRVALLSNGTEAGKGPREIVGAHQLLLEHTGLNFIGNIEGIDIPKGTADVVVCSGFVGNVVVKMLEGVSETVMEIARYAYKERLMWRAALAMLSGRMKRLKEITDWREYGGAPLLGFDQLFIKAHGRSGATAVENAIKVAAKAVRSKLAAEIATRMAEFEAHRAGPGTAQGGKN
jgi:glycerol-3-phosphate acyltransferase PlsX